MQLMEQIKADQLQARKEKETARAKLLTTLLGEASIIGKNDGNRQTTDVEVVKVVKKFVKNLDETAKALAGDSVKITMIQIEKSILENYLPQQMNEQALAIVVQNIILENLGSNEVSPKMMGVVMKQLKAEYDGQYDGKVASAIVKKALA